MNSDDKPPSSNLYIYIIALLILLLLSAFFSLSETAFTSANAIKLESQSKTSKRAKLALKIIKNYDEFLSTILVGNNIVNISSSAIATVLFVSHFGDIGPTLSTIVITILVLIFGEVSPKTLARENPETFAKLSAYPLYFCYFLLFPFSKFLSLLTLLLKKIFKRKDKDSQLTKEELSMLIEDMNEDGVLNDIEEDLIQKTIDYGNVKVKEVMTPKKDICYIRDNYPIDQIQKIFVDSNFSRLVVCSGDSIESAYGVIHQKDLFEFVVNKETDIFEIINKNPIITKPSNKISRLLKLFQSEHQHLAIVKHREKVVGIITMEDILEELVGEISDENDAN